MFSPRLALLLTSILWGVSFVGTKWYLTTIHPLTFTAYSLLCSGLVFLIVAFYRREPLTFRIREGALLGFLLFLLEGPQTVGLAETTNANTVFISTVGILLVPLAEWILYKKSISLFTWAALLVAFFGIHILTGGVNNFSQGDLWISLAAIGCMFYMVYLDHFEREGNSHFYTLCAQQFLFGGLISLFFSYALHAPLGLQTSDGSWLPLVIITLLFTLIPYALLQYGEKLVGDVEAVFFSILEPVIGGIAAWTIGGEEATLTMILGGMLVILSLIIYKYPNLRFKKG